MLRCHTGLRRQRSRLYSNSGTNDEHGQRLLGDGLAGEVACDRHDYQAHRTKPGIKLTSFVSVLFIHQSCAEPLTRLGVFSGGLAIRLTRLQPS